MTNKVLTSFIFAAALASAEPLSSAPRKEHAEPVSRSFDAAALRMASRLVYSAHSFSLDKPLVPQAIQAVVTPEPNTNLLIGVSLLGIAFLLKRKSNPSRSGTAQTAGLDILDSAPKPLRRR